MPGTAVLLHCQRPTAFSVFSHARRRDNRVCYAFSHNGQVHAPPAPRCKESGGPREREREREGGGTRWWDEEAAMGSEVGVQVRGNRVSYSVDCVHRFGDEIL